MATCSCTQHLKHVRVAWRCPNELGRTAVARATHVACTARLACRATQADRLRYRGSDRRRSCRTGAAGMCFDAACQQSQDVLFMISILLPPLIGVLAYLLIGRLNSPRRRVPAGGASDGEEGKAPERAAEGIYRAVSYTTWPADPGAEGEKLRIEVGPVGDRVPQTFIFDRTLPRASELLAVTLPRPMGIVFGESHSGRVVVGGLLEGSVAHQRSQVAKLDAARRAQAALPGDVLRACTCTNFVYETSSLFGARPPRRTIVLYGADDRRWPQVINALERGGPADGPVTLVLERELQSD